jgi:ATP-dependent RNA helicase SUPV3L1/SUV3
LKLEALALRALLWSVHGGIEPVPRISLGRPSLSRRSGIPRGFYEAVGYRVLGRRAFRVDIIERVSAQARRLARQGTPASSTILARLLDCADDELAPALAALGYHLEASEEGVRVRILSRRRRPSQSRRGDGDKNDRNPHSPFAALEVLRSAL